jgi:hypothetical protein
MLTETAMAVQFDIGTIRFTQPIRLPQSARGLAQSKTLRAIRELRANALRFGLRRPSAAFSNAMARLCH